MLFLKIGGQISREVGVNFFVLINKSISLESKEAQYKYTRSIQETPN
jgi:hypothetical protein